MDSSPPRKHLRVLDGVKVQPFGRGERPRRPASSCPVAFWVTPPRAHVRMRRRLIAPGGGLRRPHPGWGSRCTTCVEERPNGGAA